MVNQEVPPFKQVAEPSTRLESLTVRVFKSGSFVVRDE